MEQNDVSAKAIVFSQFVNMLDLIEFRLQKVRFDTIRAIAASVPKLNLLPVFVCVSVCLGTGSVQVREAVRTHERRPA